MADQATLISRVNKLYEKARSTQFEAERDALLGKADELVRAHALEAALADFQAAPEQQQVPTAVTVPMEWNDGWGMHCSMILTVAAKQNNVYPVRLGFQGIVLVGFQSDIDFTQLLYATLQIHFLRNIEPGWDTGEGLDYNVYMLKTAGVKWRQIAGIATANGHPIPWSEKSQDGRRLITAYKRYCKAHDIDPTHQTQSHDDYRQGFADAYVNRLNTRLQEMRDDYDPDSVAEGAGLALRSRMDRVMDEVYRLYPQLHPDEMARRAREAKEENDRWWASLTEKERQKLLKQTSGGKPESFAKFAARSAGRDAGRTAADKADLTPGRNDMNASNRKAL